MDWANKRINTSSNMIKVNATMDVIITEPMKFWFYFSYGLIPVFGAQIYLLINKTGQFAFQI
ncbi:MAG TPA: hypothetical protein DEP37_14075 [Algoriphagus sp.]|nr:hypothetical protein [Algoriphagus sp.]